MAELRKTLTAVFGTGKSFSNRETSEIEAGTEISGRYENDGWHFFRALEYGRWNLYAVQNAGILDDAIGK